MNDCGLQCWNSGWDLFTWNQISTSSSVENIWQRHGHVGMKKRNKKGDLNSLLCIRMRNWNQVPALTNNVMLHFKLCRQLKIFLLQPFFARKPTRYFVVFSWNEAPVEIRFIALFSNLKLRWRHSRLFRQIRLYSKTTTRRFFRRFLSLKREVVTYVLTKSGALLEKSKRFWKMLKTHRDEKMAERRRNEKTPLSKILEEKSGLLFPIEERFSQVYL